MKSSGRTTAGGGRSVRADQEQYVALVYKGEVKLVAEIEDIEPTRNNKRAFRGPVLGLDHPVANQLVGSKMADGFRNPVRYIGEPDITVTCACGCGEPVSGGQTFVSGHDQRAIRDRIKQRWGSTAAFIEWFDSQPEGLGDSAAIAKRTDKSSWSSQTR